MGVTAWFRRLAACEYGGGIVEYVGVSGLALLVTGWIIVTISAQRFVIGRAMADIHARQITSFESGLGGTANTDAQLYPRVTPPALPVIDIPHVMPAQLVIGIPRLTLPMLPVIDIPHVTPAQPIIGIPGVAPLALPVLSVPRLFSLVQ